MHFPDPTRRYRTAVAALVLTGGMHIGTTHVRDFVWQAEPTGGSATHDAAVVAPPPAHPAAVHVPAGHSTHPPIPTSAPYFPAGHSAHPTTPVAAAAVTAVLALAACALYMPTAHAVQNAAPATALNRPASHATQLEPVAAVAVR